MAWPTVLAGPPRAFLVRALSSLLTLGTMQTDVGSYQASWSFAGNADYFGSSGTSTVDIRQADANITITPYSGTYDGSAHGVGGTATGVQGEDLSSQLDLGGGQTDAGSYQVNWSFAGNIDYAPASGTSTIDIGQANANITITPYSGTYDGTAHGLSGTATGVQGEDLSSQLDLGGGQTDAGSYQVSWSFAGNVDYTPASGTSTIDIGQANANITITPYSGAYDGTAHGVSGTATWVQGEDLSSQLDLGGTQTDAGSYQVSWSFGGSTDYAPASGTSTIDIARRR